MYFLLLDLWLQKRHRILLFFFLWGNLTNTGGCRVPPGGKPAATEKCFPAIAGPANESHFRPGRSATWRKCSDNMGSSVFTSCYQFHCDNIRGVHVDFCFVRSFRGFDDQSSKSPSIPMLNKNQRIYQANLFWPGTSKFVSFKPIMSDRSLWI